MRASPREKSEEKGQRQKVKFFMFRDCSVNQHRILELAVLFDDSYGKTLSADKKRTVEKKEK